MYNLNIWKKKIEEISMGINFVIRVIGGQKKAIYKLDFAEITICFGESLL